MKKLLTFALVLALTLTLSVSAFAATVTTNGGSASIGVNGTYVPGAAAAEVVSVDISWGAMTFTYTGASEGEWNAETHQFENAAPASWKAEGNDITVKNHSNTEIEAELTFAAAEGLGVVGSFTESNGVANDGKLTLASAVGTTPAEAPSATVSFNVTGGAIDATGKIGTITVKITNK